MSDYFDLPIDLFAEILVRLPIQDLVKSTAVCKSWNSLIKTPAFISTHLEKTISFNNSKNTHLLLFRLCTVPQPELRNFPSEVLLEHFSLRFDSKDVDEYKQLQFPCHRFGFGSRRDSFEIAGSINGDKDRNLILAFDVSEEVFREIPLPECLSNDPKKLEYTDLLKYGQSIAAQYEKEAEMFIQIQSLVEEGTKKFCGTGKEFQTSLAKDLKMELEALVIQMKKEPLDAISVDDDSDDASCAS
ncbi:hypothetical protein COLO4_22868 [Corchorus olitorius]|uniref:F-box domain-containing protein n=1 Tax=Corchorus olitorius TaxID=93759 RepID=A0A1R3IJL1_9ROSI|nr:hypothetical protein COLO4_22868 [Corchorus olitorius]